MNRTQLPKWLACLASDKTTFFVLDVVMLLTIALLLIKGDGWPGWRPER